MTQSSEFNEIEKLNTAMQLLKKAEMKVSDIFDGLAEVIQNTRQDIISLEAERKELREQKADLQEKADRQKRQISGLTRDQMNLLKEYEGVKVELEKFTKVATSIGTINLEDMRATLAIYGTLFQEVFASRPHFKILYMLHGDIQSLTIDQLKGAMGIGGALILRACHELANANLIEFDENTHKIKLLQRFFPKRENS
jgi:hypothetical protein